MAIRELSVLHGKVLIETLWNVKREHKKWILRDFAVLIETLWNVNQELQTDIEIINFVLIETLWNVNSNDDIELLDHMLY